MTANGKIFRKEMQKVLAEVTDHMEQQYSAHKALDKLRADNETVAIKEKERMVRNGTLITAIIIVMIIFAKRSVI